MSIPQATAPTTRPTRHKPDDSQRTAARAAWLTATVVAQELFQVLKPKRQQSLWLIYADDAITVKLDSGSPTVSVELATGERVLDVQLGGVYVYRPGCWVEYLAGLAAGVRQTVEARSVEERERDAEAQAHNWQPVDDGALFGAVPAVAT